MKSDLYDDELNNFLFIAEQLAKELHHSFVGVAHVFFAILYNKSDSSLGEVQCIATLTLRVSAADCIGQGAPPTSTGDQSKSVVTPGLKAALLEAQRLASTALANKVNAKHLLAAICNVSYPIFARIMQANQTNPTEFRKQLMDQLHLE